MQQHAVAFMALTSIVGAAAAAEPPANDQTVAELRALVNDLRSEVDQLKAHSDQDWLTEQRATEIRAIVEDVLSDADSRTSLQGSGLMAGYDKGFFISSADGNFKLNVFGQLQIRYVYNYQNNSPQDDNRSGFEVRRAKIGVKGHVVDPSWQYEVLFAADRTTGNVQLEDSGFIQKNLGDGWLVKTGQFKAPYLREETLSSTRLFAVERTLVNSAFTAGTVRGLQVGWEGDNLHWYGMFHNGNNSTNRPWNTEDTEFAFSSRIEWLAMGDWKKMNDYDSFRDEGNGFVLGAAINYNKAEYGTGHNLPAPDFNNAELRDIGATVDATIDFGGASLAGAFVYRNQQTDTGSSSDLDVNQYGFFVRGGIFVADDWELFGQYEFGDLDNSSIDELSVITVGVNKYFAKHAIKWTTDFGYGINAVAAQFAQTGAGWRPDAPDEDGQFVFRTQLQLLF